MAATRFVFYAHDPCDRTRIAEVPFTSFSYTDVLSRPGSFQATLPLYHRLASFDTLVAGGAVVYVERDGDLVWAGWLLSAEATAGPDDYEFRVSGPGLFDYWHRRTVRSRQGMTEATGTAPNEVIWTAEDQFAIVDDLVDHAASIAGGATIPLDGVRFRGPGAAGVSGITRSKTVYAYERKRIGQLVEEFAKQTDGFDFGIEYEWDSSGGGVPVPRQYLALYYPQRGLTTPSVTLEHGGNASLVRVVRDAGSLANPLTGVGAGNADAQLTVEATDPSYLAPAGPYPYVEGQVEYRDWGVEYAGNLTRFTNAGLSQSRAPVDTATFQLVAHGSPTRPGDISLGDAVTATAQVRDWSWQRDDLRVMAQGYAIGTEGLDSWEVATAPRDATLGLV